MKSNPKLADWLGALAEMRELQTLTLQWASPEAPSFPFDVERTVTLPSLTDFNLEALLKECVLALGHLDLLALTWLSLEAISMPLPKRGMCKNFFCMLRDTFVGLSTLGLCKASSSAIIKNV